MRIATTPTHTFTFPETIRLSEITEAEFVYGQCGEKKLTKTLDDFVIDYQKNTFSITLTQDETKLFAPGEALVQAKIKTSTGSVLASQIIIFNVKPVLNSEDL